MKKVFAIFALAAVLVACNNEGTATDAAADSIRRADSIETADSIAAANAAAITPATDSLNAAADSLKAAADSLKK